MVTQLILVPSAIELAAVPHEMQRRWLDAGVAVELCGIGPIAAAAMTSHLLARLRPAKVTLMGIAGAYRAAAQGGVERATMPRAADGCVVGCAYQFGTILCHGIGVGEGIRHRSDSELGWDRTLQLPSVPRQIKLEVGGPAAGQAVGQVLLSVCAASIDEDEAAERQRRHPQAAAEDMESYAVAVACRIADTPLGVVRGISNITGDRNHHRWKIDAAMASAARCVDDVAFS